MHFYIRPNEFVAIVLPSDQTKLIKLVPNSYAPSRASCMMKVLTGSVQNGIIRKVWELPCQPDYRSSVSSDL